MLPNFYYFKAGEYIPLHYYPFERFQNPIVKGNVALLLIPI